jgi:hypothetical protein
MLRDADCSLVADVSGQPIGSIFKGQTVFLHCLTLEGGTDGLSRKVGNYLSTLRYTPEERRAH